MYFSINVHIHICQYWCNKDNWDIFRTKTRMEQTRKLRSLWRELRYYNLKLLHLNLRSKRSKISPKIILIKKCEFSGEGQGGEEPTASFLWQVTIHHKIEAIYVFAICVFVWSHICIYIGCCGFQNIWRFACPHCARFVFLSKCWQIQFQGRSARQRIPAQDGQDVWHGEHASSNLSSIW